MNIVGKIISALKICHYPGRSRVTRLVSHNKVALVVAISAACVRGIAELSSRRKLHTRTVKVMHAASTVRPRMHADTHLEVPHDNRQTTRAHTHSVTRRHDAESA